MFPHEINARTFCYLGSIQASQKNIPYVHMLSPTSFQSLLVVILFQL